MFSTCSTYFGPKLLKNTEYPMARPSVESSHTHVRYYSSDLSSCDQVQETFADRIECVHVAPVLINGIGSIRDYARAKRSLMSGDMLRFYSNLYTEQHSFYEGLQQSHLDEMIEWAHGLPTPSTPAGLRGKIILPWQLLACAHLPIPSTREPLTAYIPFDQQIQALATTFNIPIETEIVPDGTSFFRYKGTTNERVTVEIKVLDRVINSYVSTRSYEEKKEIKNLAYLGLGRQWDWKVEDYLNVSMGSTERRAAIQKTLKTLLDMGVEVMIERSVKGERPEQDAQRKRSVQRDVSGTRHLGAAFNLPSSHTQYFRNEVYDVINNHLVAGLPTIFRDHVCDSYGSCCTHAGISLFNWGVHKPIAWYADEPTITPDQVEAAYTAYKANTVAFGRRRLRRDSRGRFL
jgi:hypothetical protein